MKKSSNEFHQLPSFKGNIPCGQHSVSREQEPEIY